MIPVVTTARLRLRPHTPGDIDAATAMWADRTVTRFTGGRAFTREESWARLLRYTGTWDWFGYGLWAVEEIESGSYVGQLGLGEFARDTVPPLPLVPEVGWSFVAAAHGRGFASEGVRAALAWADANVAADRTMCLIDPANIASIRVAPSFFARHVIGDSAVPLSSAVSSKVPETGNPPLSIQTVAPPLPSAFFQSRTAARARSRVANGSAAVPVFASFPEGAM